MASVIVFDENTLRRSFMLLVPPRRARALARRWMNEVPADDRARTKRVYFANPVHWRDARENPIAVETRGATGTAPEYSKRFRESTTEEREAYLLRESDFILNLVASTSVESFEAIRRLRGDSSAFAHRRLSWMHLWLADFCDHPA